MLREGIFSFALLVSAAAAVADDQPDFFGSVDREAVRAVIRDHLREIRSCYEAGLKKNPRLSGRAVLEWDIGDGGKVTGTKVIRSVEKSVDGCMTGQIAKWTFPTPPAGQVARVRYPFAFYDVETADKLPSRSNEAPESDFEKLVVSADLGKAPFTLAITGPAPVIGQKGNSYDKYSNCGFSVQWGDGESFPKGLKRGDSCAGGFQHVYQKPGLYKVIFLLTETSTADESRVVRKFERAIKVE